MRFFVTIAYTIFMKNQSKEYKQILNKLTTAEPNEVGDMLKEYFNARKKNKK